MESSRKTVIFSIALIILIFTCSIPASAGTYSITQSSKYAISTDGTIFKDVVPIHIDLSNLSNPDLENLKEKMNAAKWESKAHYDSTNTTMDVFKNEIDKSDIHFHAGHGLNIPFIVGGHIELKNHPLPNNAVNANDVKGKWNHCKWFIFHTCHTLEDQNWANVLKGSNTHGILGFGSTTYTTGYFLSDYGEKITNGWTLAKAWEQTSYDQMNREKEIVTVRSFFKNIVQYENDKLDAPSPTTYEEIVMCDKMMGNGNQERKASCKFLKTGKEVEFNSKTNRFEPKQEL